MLFKAVFLFLTQLGLSSQKYIPTSDSSGEEEAESQTQPFASEPALCSHFPPRLAARVYLYSFVTGQQSVLLEHWLRHYNRLGIDLRRRAHIRLHTATKGSGPELEELEKSRLVLNRIAGADTFVESEAWSSELKSNLATLYLKSLPFDAMLIYADLDEFFEYRCDQLEAVLNSRTPVAIRGSMQDRVAADFRLRSVQPIVPMAEQFPQRCRILRLCLVARSSKYTLMPARDFNGTEVRFQNAHNFDCKSRNKPSNKGGNCANLTILQGPSFPHYHFTRYAQHFSETKAATYMNNSKAESKGQKKYKANKYSRETSMVYRADSETGLVQINEWCRPTCNASLSFFGMPAKEVHRLLTQSSPAFLIFRPKT